MENWRTRANCKGIDTELFFPDRAHTKEPYAVCAGCEVQAECRADAEPFGIWGGMSERERRRQHRLEVKARRAKVS